MRRTYPSVQTITFSLISMSGKNKSSLRQSNAETEDGDEEDRENPSAEPHPPDLSHIRNVWDNDFSQQMQTIAELATRYNVISIDTEFPGNFVSKHELRKFYSEQQIEYHQVRQNVEKTHLIQIGITLADQSGSLPKPVCTWQFHFKFDIDKENTVQSSIDLLKNAGINFDHLKIKGINHSTFAEQFLASGLVLNKKIKWIVFHGSSDFSYLLRLLRNQSLPKTIEDFYKSIKVFFPSICDLKQLIFNHTEMKDMGLARLSQQMGCLRIGPQHQAGSDSLLTLECYFKLLRLIEQNKFKQLSNKIFGFGCPEREMQPNQCTGQYYYVYDAPPQFYNRYNAQYGYQLYQNIPQYFQSYPYNP